ncbi:hypothetical protein LEP1GSC008_1910 [Leptospira kirschneri serovar Bulgarica str. Nikolaevo]|uniref:Uncharacterized protein n=1 Tax=Leptospira kirschneri serovar Bulgarica str. Nikolaevo TaxID=1240687 RepID=M6FPR2_9LEPT|nr:hypothetical protein LEP1GSC008_1910 [Leptospira kirschneri serovar Bulgarica str. Nikolaevo]
MAALFPTVIRQIKSWVLEKCYLILIRVFNNLPELKSTVPPHIVQIYFYKTLAGTAQV